MHRAPFLRSLHRLALTMTGAGLCVALALTGCAVTQEDQFGEKTAQPSESRSTDDADTRAQGVNADDRQRAEEIVAGMSDEELAGAVILAHYPSTDANDGANLIRDHNVAGVIVMGYNLSDGAGAQELEDTTSTLADAADDRAWPGLIGVDQEGGPVARVRSATLPFPSLMAAGAVQDKSRVRQAMRLQGDELRERGFSIDFAPVADVTIGKEDAAINLRSAGDDDDAVAATVSAAINGYSEAGIASAAKHFPGHGALTVDSHESLPVSHESLEEMSRDQWEPFRVAAQENAPMIMVGHIGLPGKEDLPSSLNPDVYEALRDDIGFDGVAITDALNMGAIQDEPGQDALKAIQAGADLALMPSDTTASVQAIAGAIGSGDLDRKQVQDSAQRVVALSLWQQHAGESAQQSSTTGAAESILDDYADAALTVVKGGCSFDAQTRSFTVTGGEESSRTALTTVLEEEGLTEGGGMSISIGSGDGDVVIGDGAPWEVDRSGADTVINTYSGNEYAMRAAARYLAGTLTATGKSPVELRSSPPECEPS